MAFLNFPLNVIVAAYLQHFDNVCRADLYNDDIVSERDYVSNLATHIRYPLGSLGGKLSLPFSGFTALTSPGGIERAFGCDGIIIISSSSDDGTIQSKVGLFEAKWPRYFGGSRLFFKTTKTGKRIKKTYQWDTWKNRKAKKKLSRFSSQIELQKTAHKMGFAVWEQFMCENQNGTSVDGFAANGSTCVLHEKAVDYITKFNPNLDISSSSHQCWDNNDLQQIIKMHGQSFADIIMEMAACNIGIPFTGVGNEIRVPFPTTEGRLREETAIADTQEPLAIPLPTGENRGLILAFMRKHGLEFYCHIDLTNPKVRPIFLDMVLKNLE